MPNNLAFNNSYEGKSVQGYMSEKQPEMNADNGFTVIPTHQTW